MTIIAGDTCIGGIFRNAAAGSMTMIAELTGEFRQRGLWLVSLLVITSFAFIPVRCDASAAPHSIFLAPNMLNHSGEHAHHAAEKPQGSSAKTVPHHSPVTGDPSTHQHGESNSASDRGSSPADDPNQSIPSTDLGTGSDPESQQPVGAALDLPTTSVDPTTTLLRPLDTQPQLLIFAPAAVLSGISAPPEFPPPKPS